MAYTEPEKGYTGLKGELEGKKWIKGTMITLSDWCRNEEVMPKETVRNMSATLKINDVEKSSLVGWLAHDCPVR